MHMIPWGSVSAGRLEGRHFKSEVNLSHRGTVLSRLGLTPKDSDLISPEGHRDTRDLKAPWYLKHSQVQATYSVLQPRELLVQKLVTSDQQAGLTTGNGSAASTPSAAMSGEGRPHEVARS